MDLHVADAVRIVLHSIGKTIRVLIIVMGVFPKVFSYSKRTGPNAAEKQPCIRARFSGYT